MSIKKNTFDLFGSKCCVCGGERCEEATDHKRIMIEELSKIIEKSKNENDELNKLKQSVKLAYQSIKVQVNKMLNHDELIFQQWLNRLYFTQKYPKGINIPLLCQLMERNYQNLPYNNLDRMLIKMNKFANKLNESTDSSNSKQEIEEEQNSILSNVRKYIEELNANFLSFKLKRYLPVQSITKTPFPSLRLKKSISQILNPQEGQYLQTYEWKNLKIRRTTRNLQLSNKQLTDIDMIKQIDKFSNFRNLQTIEIRNNKISALACKLIANHMNFLEAVDIRGNKIGDEGILIIVRAIPSLKSLMISQTGATNISGRQIISKLHHLEMLWSEYTHLTGEVVLQISKKKSVRVVSVVGNPIEQEYIAELKKIFNSKGHIML